MIAVLLVLGIVILIAALMLRSRSMPPVAGKPAYSDTDKRVDILAPISSHRNRLTGKPDYVYETPAASTPVEVKKHRIGRFPPRPWDVAQLMTYGVLLEDNGATVREGLLEYSDKRITLPYGTEQRRKVLEQAEQIREERRAGRAARSHSEVWRCRSCGVREACDQRLA